MPCFSHSKCFETEIRNAKYFSIKYFSMTSNAGTETKLVFNVHTNTSFVDCFSVLYHDDADGCC